MIYGTDPKTGVIRPLTAKEIKAEIMYLNNFSTTQEYQRAYDSLRNRVRNYETLTGVKTINVNEVMLRIARRNFEGRPLTAEQQTITNISSASPSTFRKNYLSGRISVKQEETAKLGLIGNEMQSGVFSALIEKSATTKANLNRWLNEVVGSRVATDDFGRPLKDKNGNLIRIDILRSSVVTSKDLYKFLAKQAKELHARQEQEYRANKAYYDSRRRYPGSD